MHDELEAYLAAASDEVRPVAVRVRALIRDELPQAEEAFKWKRPVYEVDGTGICYLAASKAHLTLGFSRGRELSDPDGALEGAGTQMAHVKLRRLEDVDEGRIRAWLQEAVRLERDG